MKERLSNEFFSPTLEDEKLFSFNRTLRGAKIGAICGSGLILAGTAVASLIIPDFTSKYFENPLEVVKVVSLVTAYHGIAWGVVGATIDTFRPTSRLATTFMTNDIKTFKSIFTPFRTIYSHLREKRD